MTKDKIVSGLIKQMADRSNQGINKYKNTIDKAEMNPIQAIENATIKGKDSTMVSKVYEKTRKEFKRLVDKEQSK